MKEGVRNRAFETAFAEYADELFRHAFFRLSDRERAVDLVQDTFLRAYDFAKEGDIRDMRAFLYRTLKNLIIDEYRRKKSVSLDALAEREEMDAEAMLPPDESNTLEAAAHRLDAEAALARVADLPPAYAEIILLRYVDGLSPQEIAGRLQITENLASVRIYRAQRALRALIETP